MIWECHTLTTNPGDSFSLQGFHQGGNQAPFTLEDNLYFNLPSSMKARTFRFRLREGISEQKNC